MKDFLVFGEYFPIIGAPMTMMSLDNSGDLDHGAGKQELDIHQAITRQSSHGGSMIRQRMHT